jgi:chemotaxis protein MotB
MADEGLRPIIVKRIKKTAAGGHGGAWKIAYADFVTAMMAFFLLMWLLNATTEEQRTGLADYFAPTNLFGRSASGSGQPFGGQTPHDSGTSASTFGSPRIIQGRQSPQQDVEDDDADTPATPLVRAVNAQDDGSDPHRGTGNGNSGAATQPGRGRQALVQGGDYAAARLTPPKGQEPPSGTAEADAARRDAIQNDIQRERRALEQAGAQLMDAIRRDPALQDAADQLTIDSTPEGLRIQVVDAERRPMFGLGSATPTKQVRALMQKVVPALAGLPNAITIAGHTDALTYRGLDKSNWELSADRANATRRILVEAGLAEDRVRSVTGNADRDLLIPADKYNPSNRRITIIVLRHAGVSAAVGTGSGAKS